MNPVEIEEAVSDLAREHFERAEFPFQFLAAFDNPETTIKRLRSGSTNQSDILGGVLQRNNIHIATCDVGAVGDTLKALRESPKTASAKAKFILATDGEAFQAEDLNGGGTVACTYAEFPDHFGFFLPLAGITTVKEIRESSFDVKATGRLNRLYIQLLKENPDWAKAERQHDMNHFMARLIFCFFAEDTDIFLSEGLFTKTVEQMSAGDAAITHTVIGEIFRAMDTKAADRDAAGLPRYAVKFPYVNGQLFSGSTQGPRFSKVARSYLMHIGSLNWRKINPDIFGSMIQAVTDDAERGSLGMHYTSVPNILKVLNPLFLDDLRAKLEEAGDNARKLLNLRNRMSRIRVFDPACGSGNFLVIAYKEMRGIEAEINTRRGEADRRSDIPLTNFRGIELRDFPAEIARLALIIAEYQCDVICRGQKEAVADFLPLGAENWITCGNALSLDWVSLCGASGTKAKVAPTRLFEEQTEQADVNFENEGGEIYICGNPPYKGSQDQTAQQKDDLKEIFLPLNISSGSADYVLGWFVKACAYVRAESGKFAFVSTNSIHQGRQVARFWPSLLDSDLEIVFAEPSFRWSNLASNKAVVSVSIIAIAPRSSAPKIISDSGLSKVVDYIGPYLVPDQRAIVEERRVALSSVSPMSFGSMPNDGGQLLLDPATARELHRSDQRTARWIHPFYGTNELTKGLRRFCLWLSDADRSEWEEVPLISERVAQVRAVRSSSKRATTKALADSPHRFGEVRQSGDETVIAVGGVSSESREYLPADLLPSGTIISNLAYCMPNAPAWNLAIVLSKMHTAWIATVCGKLETRYRFSSTLGWNTFPLPKLTEQNKADLSRTADAILLAREAHYPATIADLYDPEAMPDDLRRAHEANDEVVERIYIGRRFRNDTERLEKLFELYTKMTSGKADRN